MLAAEVTAMTIFHVQLRRRAHLPALALPTWFGPTILGILLSLAVLLLRAVGWAAPDLTLPISPFVLPGAPDLYATTA
jgi:hypothetical protein